MMQRGFRTATTFVFWTLLILLVATAVSVASASGQPSTAARPLAPAVGTWTQVTLPSASPALEALEVGSATNIWAVGDLGTIWHWDGTTWSKETTGVPTDATLESAAAVPGNAADAWVVGVAAQAVILHRTGPGTWTAVSSPVTGQLDSIDMFSATNGWIVGDHGATLQTTDGATWNQVPATPVTTVQLHAVMMQSATNVLAVGEGSTILHYNGTTWTPETSPLAGLSIFDVWWVNADEAWAVGVTAANDGTILHRTAGGVWTKVFSDSTSNSDVKATLYNVSMVNANDGWTVGTGGTMIHWDGTGWTPQTPVVTEPLAAVRMLPTGEGWSDGGNSNTPNSGVVLHMAGGAVNLTPRAYLPIVFKP